MKSGKTEGETKTVTCSPKRWQLQASGVDFDETLAAQRPYQRAYLPINRLEDGTTTAWWHCI